MTTFDLILSQSEYVGTANLEQVETWDAATLGHDPHDTRRELLDLVRKAKRLKEDTPARAGR